MSYLTSYEMKGGSILATLDGYSGEEDFYAMYEIIKELVEPDHITFGVDSMCVDGSFRKDGILVRISSESAFDYACFFYEPQKMSEEERARAEGWMEAIAEKLHETREPHYEED